MSVEIQQVTIYFVYSFLTYFFRLFIFASSAFKVCPAVATHEMYHSAT
jgi:hypothetical protein